MYLEISSKGEIEVEAFTLMGNSTKRDDNTKVGQWGSGSKYSIASMLNQNINFKVFSGDTEIKFTTQNTSFRGTSLKQIYINGEQTSLTTAMGHEDWLGVFPFLREIYSNALDEDKEATLLKVSNPNPEIGKTKFYIEMTPAVQDFYENLGMYFSGGRQDVLATDIGRGSIFTAARPEVTVYRKGILAFSDKTQNPIFHYNLKNVLINESRVVKSEFDMRWEVTAILKNLTDTTVIKMFLTELSSRLLEKNLFEKRLSWSASNFSPAWFEVANSIKIVPDAVLPFLDNGEANGGYILPYDLCTQLKAQFKELRIVGLDSDNVDAFFVEKEPSEDLLNKVIEAMALLNNTNYKKRLDNPLLKYGQFSKELVLGEAKNGEIRLSLKLETEPVESIAKVIIEENEHNKTGYKDETRVFQNHWISLYFESLKNNKPC